MKTLQKHTKILQLIVIVLSLSVSQLTFAATIKDVPANDPQFEAIEDITQSGAMKTDSSGKFHPNKLINRAEFYKALFEYIDYKPKKGLEYITGFIDVPSDSWFAPYVKKALELRIISLSDYDALKFNPTYNVTRLDGLRAVLSTYGIPTPLYNPIQSEIFKDTRPNSALAYLYSSAKKHGINFNKKPDYFYPAKYLTRADTAELLYKAKHAETENMPENITPGITVITPTYSGGDSHLMQNPRFEIMLDVWNKINNEYIYPERISEDELLYGAISGMVQKLNDPYSSYQEPGQGELLYNYLNGDYVGIGIIIEYLDGQYVIQTTLNDSPASKAGLKPNDIIIEIDGKEIKDFTPQEVTALIQGKENTKVKLKIQRDNQNLNFEITRTKLNVANVKTKMFESDIGYISIEQFTDNAAQEFTEALTELKKKNFSKLIIDLRNNPGGYLDSTEKILGFFIAKNKAMFHTENIKKELTTYNSKGEGELAKYPLVILINEGSASASEIMAGALQDHGIARIVGANSFGKGTVQEIRLYQDYSNLKISIAHWLTPNKHDINEKGIKPDIEVTQTLADAEKALDTQLNKAIEEVKKIKK